MDGWAGVTPCLCCLVHTYKHAIHCHSDKSFTGEEFSEDGN